MSDEATTLDGLKIKLGPEEMREVGIIAAMQAAIEMAIFEAGDGLDEVEHDSSGHRLGIIVGAMVGALFAIESQIGGDYLAQMVKTCEGVIKFRDTMRAKTAH